MRRYTYTQTKCSTSSCGGASVLKWVGIALMVFGVLILIIAVPIQFWFALVGLALALVGFILFRLG